MSRPNIHIDQTLNGPSVWVVKETMHQCAVEFLLSIEEAEFRRIVGEDCFSDDIRRKPTKLEVRAQFKVFRKWLLQSLGKCKRVEKDNDGKEIKDTHGDVMETCSVTRRYQYTLGRKWGRRYAGVSCQTAAGVFRGIVNRLLYDDIDIVNAAPTIYSQLADFFGIPHAYLKQYVSDRKAILEDVMKFYSCTRNEAKEKFVISMYSDKVQHYKHSFLDKYDREMKSLQQAFWKREEYNFIRPHVKKDNNQLGTFFSYIYQFHEGQVLDTVMELLQSSENYEYAEVGVLSFDGLQIRKDRRNSAQLLLDISGAVKEKSGFNLKYLYKEMDGSMEVPEDFEYKGLVTFEQENEAFNEIHCKAGTVYIMKRGNENILQSRNQIKERYEHKEVLSSNEDRCNFIENWIRNNNDMRVYADMNIYPDPSMCPEDEYNLWTPFAYDLLEGEYEPDEEALELFLKHISVLCDHNKAAIDFFLMWLAHMVQHPGEKLVAVIFVSKPGAGKGRLMAVVGVCFGKKKVFESSNPKRDVWGDFNGPMKEAFLVNLNEISPKDFYEAHGKYKALVTDPTIMINRKGQDQVEMQSFHRFLGTTNSEDSVPTEEGDRRNLVIRSSDELIGDAAHHTAMTQLLSNERGMRTIWDFLKRHPCPSRITQADIPHLSFHNDLKMQNQSPIMHWIEMEVRSALEECKSVELKLSGHNNALWIKFQEEMERAKIAHYLTLPKFKRQLNECSSIPGIETQVPFNDHGRTVRGMVLNLNILKERFKIMDFDRDPRQRTMEEATEKKGYKEVLAEAKCHFARQREKRPISYLDLPDEKRNCKKPLYSWRDLQHLRDPALTGK